MDCSAHNGEMKRDYGTVIVGNHRVVGVQLLDKACTESLAIFPFVSSCVPQRQPCDAEAYGECKVWTMMSARFGGNPSMCGSNDSPQSKR